MKVEPVSIYGAVEGIVDEAVLLSLIQYVGATAGKIYGKSGKTDLVRRLNAYNDAARFRPWAILIDLDQDADCAPDYRRARLPAPAGLMCCRIAVREIESWLMADRENIAQFLAVSVARIPDNPETLVNPKRELVNIARHSRKRNIRDDMVPSQNSSLEVGNAYASRLIEFVQIAESQWQPRIAAQTSDSLDRCIRCLQHLVKQASVSS